MIVKSICQQRVRVLLRRARRSNLGGVFFYVRKSRDFGGARASFAANKYTIIERSSGTHVCDGRKPFLRILPTGRPRVNNNRVVAAETSAATVDEPPCHFIDLVTGVCTTYVKNRTRSTRFFSFATTSEYARTTRNRYLRIRGGGRRPTRKTARRVCNIGTRVPPGAVGLYARAGGTKNKTFTTRKSGRAGRVVLHNNETGRVRSVKVLRTLETLIRVVFGKNCYDGRHGMDGGWFSPRIPDTARKRPGRRG